VPREVSRLLTIKVATVPCKRRSPEIPSAEPKGGRGVLLAAVPPGTTDPLLWVEPPRSMVPSRSELTEFGSLDAPEFMPDPMPSIPLIPPVLELSKMLE
jgi:hypothetical protein